MHRTQFVRDSKVRYELEKKYTGPELQFEHRLALHCPSYCVCRESLLFHRNRPNSRVQRKNKPLQEGFEIIMDSLIAEARLANVPISSISNQLTHIYYGLIGMVIQDIFIFGGDFRERHTRFQTLIRRHRRFLSTHQESLCRYKSLQKFYVAKFPLPAFALSNALWLDAVVLARIILLKLGK